MTDLPIASNCTGTPREATVCVAGNMVCDGVKAIDVNVGAITDSVAAMAVFVAGRGVA